MPTCSTTRSRPAPPYSVRAAGAVIPASKSSTPARAGWSTGAGGKPTVPEADLDQVEAPGPAGGPHRSPGPGAEAARWPERRAPSTAHRAFATSRVPATTRCAHADAATLGVAELLLGAGEGDPGAWEEILRRYSGLVLARVRSFRLQDADALDVVQATWLRLAENSHRIQHPEYLGGWLATTADRECLRILRQAKHAPVPTDSAAENEADPSVGPEQRVIDAETRQTLRNLVAELPARRRTVLRALFTDHPRSYAELAASTGIPVGSIGPTRDRALRQLRQMLEDRQLAPQARR